MKLNFNYLGAILFAVLVILLLAYGPVMAVSVWFGTLTVLWVLEKKGMVKL